MKIEKGGFYLRRDHHTVGPAVPINSTMFPWEVGGEFYTDYGRFWADGQEDRHDLVRLMFRGSDREGPIMHGTRVEAAITCGAVVRERVSARWRASTRGEAAEIGASHERHPRDCARRHVGGYRLRLVQQTSPPVQPASRLVSDGDSLKCRTEPTTSNSAHSRSSSS